MVENKKNRLVMERMVKKCLMFLMGIVCVVSVHGQSSVVDERVYTDKVITRSFFGGSIVLGKSTKSSVLSVMRAKYGSGNVKVDDWGAVLVRGSISFGGVIYDCVGFTFQDGVVMDVSYIKNQLSLIDKRVLPWIAKFQDKYGGFYRDGVHGDDEFFDYIVFDGVTLLTCRVDDEGDYFIVTYGDRRLEMKSSESDYKEI